MCIVVCCPFSFRIAIEPISVVIRYLGLLVVYLKELVKHLLSNKDLLGMWEYSALTHTHVLKKH